LFYSYMYFSRAIPGSQAHDKIISVRALQTIHDQDQHSYCFLF
jgi:hypothetical protein